ncbi:MAG: hypothetical protein LC105_12100 [Chitinophagales bacterium]|nr:hypothetical protein [Chitinophagales bacterium]MCZ2394593.1 hypothetical protein [Chitinophagales bacterium]
MSKNRIHIHIQNQSMTILVPVKKQKKQLIVILLLALPWVLGLWTIIEVFYSTSASLWHKAFTLMIILFWSSIGVVGYTLLTFMFFGREKIFITPQQILIEKPLVFYNRRNYYLVQNISMLRVGVEQYKAQENNQWVDRERSILQLEYPEKIVSFARGTSPEEAEWILLKIAQSGLLPSQAFATFHQV